MSFDWQTFLDRYRVEYVTTGPSTAKDNLYVHCPWCGDADHGHHMGISLRGRGWGCWRESAHRGRAPLRLVKTLLGCSWQEAAAICESKTAVPTQQGFLDNIKSKLGNHAPQEPPRGVSLSMPESFKPIEHGTQHEYYMIARGLHSWVSLAEHFDLRMSRDREWQWRIIIPVYDESGVLVSWTARAIAPSRVRYKTYESTPPITDCLLNAPDIEDGGDTLLVCEGPFDCMNLWLYAEKYNIKVTGIFGKNTSPAQRGHLTRLRPRYERVVSLLDPDAYISSMKQASYLRPLHVETFRLYGKKDPGDLTPKEARSLLWEISAKVVR